MNPTRSEVSETIRFPNNDDVPNTRSAGQASVNAFEQSAIPPIDMDATWMSGYENLWDDLMTGTVENNNLTMDFWPQFDNLPIGML
jgi:hypothetical protein